MADIQGLLNKYKNIEGERFFNELFEAKEYEPALEVKADVVVDVGALAGEFCSYIYDKAQVIYALEPYSSHFAELKSNVEEFNLEKVKPFNLALGNINQQGKLKIGVRGGHIVDNEGTGPCEDIVIQTLATFMKEQGIDRIDVLKIDIEGYEKYVFSAEDFKYVADKIDYIIGEHLQDSEPILKTFGFTMSTHNNNFIFKR